MHTNPELETTLTDLSELCCDALQNGGEFNHDRAEQLAANLSTNGWTRHSQGSMPLSDELKNRIREHCPEPAIHRGAAIDGVVSKVQKLYDNAARYEDSAPDEGSASNDKPQAMSPRTMG